MSFHFNNSAGELFEFIRPAVLFLSALAATWILASTRRHGFRLPTALAWAVAALLFPLIVLPLYVAVRLLTKSDVGSLQLQDPGLHPPPSKIAGRYSVPLAFAVVVLLAIGLYLYRDYRTVDAHLARAAQARIKGPRQQAIDEYRAALRLEDNPHTHKLLAIELVAAGDLTEALTEFRLAEKELEEDDSISFRMARILDDLNQPREATVEYNRFLNTKACTQAFPDERCEMAKRRVAGL